MGMISKSQSERPFKVDLNLFLKKHQTKTLVTKGKTTADGFDSKAKANKLLAIIKCFDVINERLVAGELFSK